MTAKSLLYGIRDLDARINRLLRRSAHYRSMAMASTSVASATRNSGASRRSRVESYAVRIADMEADIDRYVDELVDQKQYALLILRRIDSAQYRQVLECRYFCAMSWDDIARDMGYTRRNVLRLHGAALLAFEREMLRPP